MTVTNTKITAGPYLGNGLSDTFSYAFGISDKSEIRVFETTDVGVETELTVDTDYTVNDVGNEAGGTVTRLAGPLPSNYQWYMRSDYPETQETSFESQGAFYPDIHERGFDKPTRLIQQLRDLLNRTLKVSDSYTGDYDLTIPNPSEKDLLRFTDSGIEGLTIGEILSESDAIISDLNMSGNRIEDLSPGTSDNDAATVGQVNEASQSALTAANGYTDQEVAQVDAKLDSNTTILQNQVNDRVPFSGGTMSGALLVVDSSQTTSAVPKLTITKAIDNAIQGISGTLPGVNEDYGFIYEPVTEIKDYGSL